MDRKPRYEYAPPNDRSSGVGYNMMTPTALFRNSRVSQKYKFYSYRFYYEKYLTAEVMLPDGSVLRSTGPTHLYFKHWIYDLKSESVSIN